MTDKIQKIKEFLIGMASAACCDAKTKKNIQTIILPFVNSLQEEPVNEELVKAAITAADEDMQGRQIMEASNEDRQLYSRIFRRGFKAGAQWKEEQMIDELCEWVKKNVTYTHPRKGTEECVINLGKLKEAMRHE